MPVSAVERVLRLAAWTPLPEAPPGVAGVLNLGGTIIPVVDARARFGLPTPGLNLDQRLVVIGDQHRYVLWVDDVEQITAVSPHAFDQIGTGEGGPEAALAPFVVRLDDGVLPVLAPEALDPGPIVGPTR